MLLDKKEEAENPLKSRHNNQNIIIMRPYEVKFKVDNTTSSRILNLQGGTESEAIATLYAQGTVSRGRSIIILSIRPA